MAYLGVIAWVTLGPVPWRVMSPVVGYDVLSPSVWLSADTWASGRLVEFLANIVLFVPLGALVRWAVPRWGWMFAAFAGAAVSTAVEVLQIGSTRVSDPRDLVANSVGAVLGAVIVAAIARVVRVGRFLSRRWAGGVRGELARPPQVAFREDLVLSNIRSPQQNGG